VQPAAVHIDDWHASGSDSPAHWPAPSQNVCVTFVPSHEVMHSVLMS
jgi:hypothetical protein